MNALLKSCINWLLGFSSTSLNYMELCSTTCSWLFASAFGTPKLISKYLNSQWLFSYYVLKWESPNTNQIRVFMAIVLSFTTFLFVRTLLLQNMTNQRQTIISNTIRIDFLVATDYITDSLRSMSRSTRYHTGVHWEIRPSLRYRSK